MPLKEILQRAVQNVPNAAYIRHQIEVKTMSLTQKLIAAIYQITEGTFVVTEEPQLIERLIEATDLTFDAEGYAAVKSHLFTNTMMVALKGIGVEITRNGSYLTVFGPGVKRHVE